MLQLRYYVHIDDQLVTVLTCSNNKYSLLEPDHFLSVSATRYLVHRHFFHTPYSLALYTPFECECNVRQKCVLRLCVFYIFDLGVCVCVISTGNLKWHCLALEHEFKWTAHASYTALEDCQRSRAEINCGLKTIPRKILEINTV